MMPTQQLSSGFNGPIGEQPEAQQEFHAFDSRVRFDPAGARRFLRVT